MTVPVHHANRIARLHPQACQAASQPADAFAQHSQRVATAVVMNYLLLGGVSQSCGQEVLYKQWVFVSRWCLYDQITRHGYAPLQFRLWITDL